MEKHNYYVYILTNHNNRVMYVGITNDLAKRVFEHKNKLIKGFTQKYHIDKLVYFEHTLDVNSAIMREKEIKKWRREKKDKLVMSINPEWKDLSTAWKEISIDRDGGNNKGISPRFARRNDSVK